MLLDFSNTITQTQTLDPAVITASASGVGVNHANHCAVHHIVNIGESGDTLSAGVKIDLVLEESDDNSTWSVVSSATDVVGGTVDSSGIFATIDDAAEDDSIHSIGYIGGKKYSRVTATLTGTHTNGTPVSMTAIQAMSRTLT